MAESAKPEQREADRAPDEGDGTPARIGRYKVERRLGSGGMAEVFLCRQSGMGGFDRHVVVKRISSHLRDREEAINMFLDEARIIAQVTHPNVVQIYDIDEQEGLPYLVMEYVKGLSFEALLKRVGQKGAKFPVDLVAALGVQACAGLNAAHELRDASGQPLGVVHRDISPNNLLLSVDGVVKIIDFGVARAKNRLAVTSAGHLKGRAGYLAPEALTDAVIDRRADLFALGVVLYELCSGKTLFDRETDLARLSAVLTSKAPPLNEVRPDADPAMADALARVLEIDPRKRPDNAALFGAALHTVAAHSGRYITSTLVADWLDQYLPESMRVLGRQSITPPRPPGSGEKTQSQPSPFSTTVKAPSPGSATPPVQAAPPPSSVSPVSSMATNLQLPQFPATLSPVLMDLAQQVRMVTPLTHELAQQVQAISPVVSDLGHQVRLMRRLYWPMVTLFWLFGLGLIMLGVWMLIHVGRDQG